MSYSFCCRRAPDVVKRTRHRFFWSDVEPVDYSVAGAFAYGGCPILESCSKPCCVARYRDRSAGKRCEKCERLKSSQISQFCWLRRQQCFPKLHCNPALLLLGKIVRLQGHSADLESDSSTDVIMVRHHSIDTHNFYQCDERRTGRGRQMGNIDIPDGRIKSLIEPHS